MTYTSLAGYSDIAAAAIAARCAHSMHYTRKNDVQLVSNEKAIYVNLVAEVRKNLDLGDGVDLTTLIKIVAALYDISDTYLNRVEENAGANTSSIYTLNAASYKVAPVLRERASRETAVIDSSIVASDARVSGRTNGQGRNHLLMNLYIKTFSRSKYPFVSFVIGARLANRVMISASLRYYPSTGKMAIETAEFVKLARAYPNMVTCEMLIRFLHQQDPSGHCIVMYATHWGNAYFNGGDTVVVRDINKILQSDTIGGFTGESAST